MWSTPNALKQNIMSRCNQDLAMSRCAIKRQHLVPEPYITYPANYSGDHPSRPPQIVNHLPTQPSNPLCTFNHSERSTALSKHPFHVTSNTFGAAQSRQKCPPTILLALEDQPSPACVPKPGGAGRRYREGTEPSPARHAGCMIAPSSAKRLPPHEEPRNRSSDWPAAEKSLETDPS